LVGDELGVDEFVADDVGENEDGVGGGLVFGVGEVGCGCVEGVSVSGGRVCGEGEGEVLSPMLFISPLASPSCLTPMVQHRAGAWDVMVVELLLDSVVVGDWENQKVDSEQLLQAVVRGERAGVTYLRFTDVH